MEITIKPYKYCPCGLEVFTINGQEAEIDDFGFMRLGKSDEYSCCDASFHAEESDKETLNKYSITEAEYEQVIKELSEKLNVGYCSMCD